MADMGFLPAVRRLVEQTAPSRQVLMFSATLDGAVATLAAAVQRRPVRHEVGPVGPEVTAAQHVFWSVERAGRAELTADVVRQLGSTMVFCRTRHGTDRLAKQLGTFGVSAAPIHGGRSQPQRDRALKAFASGAVSTLVATDVAARGLHVEDVAAVVHYDPPADPAAYVHRSGRTARAGAGGVVVSLVERGGERGARRLQRDVGIDVAVERPSLTAVRPSPPPVPAASERLTGTVTFFHDGRGYGFIDGGLGRDVFVHHSNLAMPIATGRRVSFAVRPGRKGPEAYDVNAL
jgi:superfamily II DNA/RNA helicase/cold shock CspA family protein